jgi:hypothetical protein
MKELVIGAGHIRKPRLRRINGPEEWEDPTYLDINPDTDPDVVHDLNNYPWPFDAASFDEIHAYDIIEHLGRQGLMGEHNNPMHRNNIATLKPINLMRWLVRLVTPKGGIVLDPFAGSGTTGCAAVIEGVRPILIEKRPRFANEIIPRRLQYWQDPVHWDELTDHDLLPAPSTLKNLKIDDFL